VIVESPDPSAVDRLTDYWVDLATEQRDHDSHLVAEGNRAEMRERIGRAIVSDNVRVARYEDDGIVGFVMFDVELGSLATVRTRGLVHNIYVEPAYRGEGVGSELLAAAERELADRGVETITLEVMAGNEAARRFYRQHGYDAHRVALEKPVENDTHSKENE
jgi:ribosomal protein S18 acetylase RimI-like enzyme